MRELHSSSGLYWLPETPDWSHKIAGVEQSAADRSAWRTLVSLADSRLDLVRSSRLDRTLQRKFGDAPPSDLPTQPLRLAVLGSSLTTHLLPGIRVAALRRNLWLTVYEPAFGQYLLELTQADSGLDRFGPNAILIALDAYHCVRGVPADATRDDADAALADLITHLRHCCQMARRKCDGSLLVQTPLPVLPELLGNNEQRLPGSHRRLIERYNQELRKFAEEEGVDLVAVDALAALDGVRNWHDPILWRRAKQEISPQMTPVYGELVVRVLAARHGLSRKCLVLDLDNTLWGGVVGDDGVNDLVLGHGSAAGESYLAVQAYARDLARRGVILAICSKNDEANALAVFDQHPEMLLTRQDIAAFAINWKDKASNIQAIARELNIGLNTIVFVDDNPVERDFVRSVLPMVAVPEIPDDPALVPQCLADAGYFEAINVTEDDLRKSDQYSANRERARLAAEEPDVETYLRNLQMRLVWGTFDAANLQRVVQLINKTNQFNLMTTRCSEQEVLRFTEAPNCLGLHFRLIDRFGDNGVIGVIMGRADPAGDMAIENWLMSCRVIGRQVERAMLNVLTVEARDRDVRRLIGEYRPTEKNAMVTDHYPNLGFGLLMESYKGITQWILKLETSEALCAPIELIRGGDGERGRHIRRPN